MSTGIVTPLVITQLNAMHRNGTKQINEIEAKINDIQYGRQSEVSFSDRSSDPMASNFGYNQVGRKGDAPKKADLE